MKKSTKIKTLDKIAGFKSLYSFDVTIVNPSCNIFKSTWSSAVPITTELLLACCVAKVLFANLAIVSTIMFNPPLLRLVFHSKKIM